MAVSAVRRSWRLGVRLREEINWAHEKIMKIPEIKLVPEPGTEDAKQAVGYEYNREAGHRHKLGGAPDYIQDEEWPSCCGQKMTFYAQIDSIGEKYDLADCGMIYVFVCFDCFSTQSLLQAY